MTEITDGVYQITYEDVKESDNYLFKFSANGTWTENWGGAFEGSGITSEAIYNSNEDIIFEFPY